MAAGGIRLMTALLTRRGYLVFQAGRTGSTGTLTAVGIRDVQSRGGYPSGPGAVHG
jgi:hypothetical protein